MTCRDKEDKKEPDSSSIRGPRLPKCCQAYIDTWRQEHIIEDDCMHEDKNTAVKERGEGGKVI